MDVTSAAGDVSVVMSGLDNPRGMNFGPQGALYVTEAGRGGGVGAPSIVQRGSTFYYGATGAVSRLWHGKQARVATGLPSLALANGNRAEGAHDIVFQGVGNAYVTIGLEGHPNLRDQLGDAGDGFAQLVRLKPNGTYTSVADIGTYELTANPDGRQLDSNPYGLLAEGGNGVVLTDSGGNALLRVDNQGNISTMAVMPLLPTSQVTSGDPVPTSIVVGPDGAYYVGILAGAPFRDGVASVYRLGPGEPPTVYAGGFKMIIDIDFDDAGNLYVLQHAAGPAAGPATPGSLVRVAPDGTRTTVLAGLTMPTSVAVGPDAAVYVSNIGLTAGAGEVVRLTLAPSATATAARVASHVFADDPTASNVWDILNADAETDVLT